MAALKFIGVLNFYKINIGTVVGSVVAVWGGSDGVILLVVNNASGVWR